MITNYAIVDHAGQVGACKALYKKAFAVANAKYEKVYTLKKVCEMGSPYAREITNKMKWYNRYNRKPMHVFIVCASERDPKAQFIANVWESRNISVSFIEEDTKPAHAVHEEMSKARRCALIWSNAIGWSFSAPLVRDSRVNDIDQWTARPNDNEFGSYAAQRFSRPESYERAFRDIAPESECLEFFQHYAYLQKNGLLAEFMEPGWSICPTCGRPVRESQDKCTWCDREFEAIELETFYEDSYCE